MSRAPFVLVVEDDTILRHVIAQNLQARGYLPLEAGTFRGAAEQLAVKPRLMILDITLPDATGWDVAAWLESMTSPVPIILISGGTPDAKHLQQFAPVAFLPKPFAIGALLDVVAEQLPPPGGAIYGV